MTVGSDSPRREIELDFIRGLAILLVLSFHYQSHGSAIHGLVIDRVFCCGWVGVDVFFVLSGFLVGRLIMAEWKATGTFASLRFLKRRALRIWPAYYVFLATAAIFHVRPLKSFFWQNLFNVQNYFPSSLSHTWSLAVEEHFYLMLAVVISLFAVKQWRPITLLAWCVVSILLTEVLRAELILSRRPFYFYTHARIDALLIGVVLALLYHFWPNYFERIRAQRLALALILMAACVLLYLDANPNRPPHQMSSPFLITVVDYASAAFLLLLYRPGSNHGLPYRLIAKIGICSYGIYLWHVSVERPVDFLVFHLHGLVASAASTLLPYVLAITLGVVATKVVDHPMMRLRDRLAPPSTPGKPIPVA